MITSTSNPQIKQLALLLKKGKERQKEQQFVIEGRKMFDEVCRYPEMLVRAYFSERYVAELGGEGSLPGVPYEIVSEHVFDSVAETVTPQGVLAVCRMPKYELTDMLKKQGTLVLLEDLRDPGNLGTILRTAEAAGVKGVVLSKESVDVYNPKVIRSTMGAIFRVPFLYADDFLGMLSLLKEKNVRLLAAHLGANRYYDEADYSGMVGIMIGNEANGLSEQASFLAQEKVIIPMAGETESLNAAVAAALLMYEAFRHQR